MGLSRIPLVTEYGEVEKKRWQEEARRASELYSQSLQNESEQHRAVRWGSSTSQLKRFEVLASIGELKKSTVLDVGAGLGDFYGFLSDRGFAGHYVGCDFTEAMVTTARARYPGVEFHKADVLSFNLESIDIQFDYVIASGIFTYCQYEPYRFLYAVAERMFNIAKLGIAFNCLSTWGQKPEPGECQFDPEQCLDLMQHLSRQIILRHDYLQHDFTVFLYKKPV